MSEDDRRTVATGVFVVEMLSVDVGERHVPHTRWGIADRSPMIPSTAGPHGFSGLARW
jgi:hypothetical protein